MTKTAFTLIELLMVIGIISVLSGAVFVALRPSYQFSVSRDVRRQADILTLLNALHQYTSDHSDVIPVIITTTTQPIAKTGVDLCSLLVPAYLANLPVDPALNSGTPVTDCSSDYSTGYTASQSASGSHLTISAPRAENPPLFSTR